jgi:CheY-like chemotaxis protein
MDLVMPVLNGWEAIAQLKADTFCGALPIVAITACAETETKERACAVGFDALISKPFTMHELLAVVDALTGVAEEAIG